MPTAFTAGVIDGEMDFAAFAKACTHAFCFPIRELPLDAPLPTEPFEADTKFYEEALAEAQAELAAAEAWSPEEARAAAVAAYEATVEAEGKHEEKAKRNRERLEAVLAQAEAWEPPTPKHQAFKDFMVEQLKGSIEFDGTHTSYRDLTGGVPEDSGENHRLARIQAAKDAIKRDEEQIAKITENAKANTEWLAAVVASV